MFFFYLSVKCNEVLMSPENNAALPFTFHLECSHIYAFYYEYSKATESLAAAKKLAGLEIDMIGKFFLIFFFTLWRIDLKMVEL